MSLAGVTGREHNAVVPFTPDQERRKHNRLPLSFAFFVRGTNHEGKPFRELLTALNVSSGGMLALASPKFVPAGHVQIDLPVGGKGEEPRPTHRELWADVVRIEQRSRYKLVGLRFQRALV